VTISGLLDHITSTGRNFYDGDYSRDGDREWYGRLRFRPDFQFEVGRTKSVLGLEVDLTYGQAGATDGGFPGNTTGTNAGCKIATNGCLDSNTDVGGVIEIKWAYTEFELTGSNSLLPFLPVKTSARAGGQPFAHLATYKVAYATGDFAGLSLVTDWSPEVRSNLAYVQLEAELAGSNRGLGPLKLSRGNDFAVIASVDVTPFKGLDVKPLYSYFHPEGTTQAARRNAFNPRTVGGNVAGAAAYANAADLEESRHTFGFDARWRREHWSFNPTVLYQTGTRETQARLASGATGVSKASMSSWLIDLVGGWQRGSWLVEARTIYSTGNRARDNLAKRISYFEPLSTDTTFGLGWGDILALSSVDYFNGGGSSNAGMASNVGYDRYGRAQLLGRAVYSVTPALSVLGRVSPTWTAEAVDTDTGVGGASVNGARTIVNDRSFVRGDSRYIGTEADLGMTYQISSNLEFSLAAGWLFAGPALDTLEIRNGVAVRRKAHDAWTLGAQLRFFFHGVVQ
jgi:hypothetical protein